MDDKKSGRISGAMSELHSWNYPTALDLNKGKVYFDDVNNWVTDTKNASDELLNKVDSLEKVEELFLSDTFVTEDKRVDALVYLLKEHGELYPWLLKKYEKEKDGLSPVLINFLRQKKLKSKHYIRLQEKKYEYKKDWLEWISFEMYLVKNFLETKGINFSDFDLK